MSTDTAKPLPPLVIAAIGIVFGDIGTSPLYAIKACFGSDRALPLDEAHVLGILSLVFWLLALVVSGKYLGILLRADNRGEGGSLSLLTLALRVTRNNRLAGTASVLGIFAAALFYGDSMLTPAISVLSAVEGVELASPGLSPFVIPITLTVIAGLFFVQRRGTGTVGIVFGPLMCLWFGTLAVTGLWQIIQHPVVLLALNPLHAAQFFISEPLIAFLALGAVVLVITGAAALYTDMGHFGRRPIRLAWFLFVGPALLLNYFGQGALILREPDARFNPFYHMAPEWSLIPMILLATAAAVIASQAVISGAFSLTRQAIQLGLLPRMSIVHTSAQESGQIYIPFVNGMLFVLVCLLVVGFGGSSDLASAYGVAVTATMLIDTLLLSIVMILFWRWNRWLIGALALLFIVVDGTLFAANAIKIPHGGWFPLAVASTLFVLLTTWKLGRQALRRSIGDAGINLPDFIASTATVPRVPGTAIFMTPQADEVPSALLHNLKHNKVMHERTIILGVETEDVPFVPAEERVRITPLDHGFSIVNLYFGFMDNPNVPRALELCSDHGLSFDSMETSYFLSRETLVIRAHNRHLPFWRAVVFAWMTRNAASAMRFFRLPPNRVIELGRQVEI